MMGHGTLRRQVQWHFLVLLHLRTWGPDLGCLSNQASKLLERSEKVEDPAQPMLEFLEPGSLPVDRLRTCVAGQSHQNLGRVQLSLKRLRQQSCEKKTGVSWTLLLGARTLLGAPGLTTRNKKLTQVGAPKRRPVGMAPFHVFVQRAQAHRSAAMDTLTSADGHAFSSLEEHVSRRVVDQPRPGSVKAGIMIQDGWLDSSRKTRSLES